MASRPDFPAILSESEAEALRLQELFLQVEAAIGKSIEAFSDYIAQVLVMRYVLYGRLAAALYHRLRTLYTQPP